MALLDHQTDPEAESDVVFQLPPVAAVAATASAADAVASYGTGAAAVARAVAVVAAG